MSSAAMDHLYLLQLGATRRLEQFSWGLDMYEVSKEIKRSFMAVNSRETEQY